MKKNKSLRDFAAIFDSLNPDNNYPPEQKKKKKFKTSGLVSNEYSSKYQKTVSSDEQKFDVMLTAIKHPEYSL